MAATFGLVRHFDLGSLGGTASAHPAAVKTVSLPLALPQPGAARSEPDLVMDKLVLAPDAVVLTTPTTDSIQSAPADEATTQETAPAALPSVPQQAAGDDAPSLLQQVAIATSEALDTDQEPALPALAAAEEDVVAEPRWTEHRVANGESLAKIFSAQGLDARLLHNIVTSSKQAQALAQIRPGQKLRFQFDENQELTKLELQRNRVESIRVSIADDEIAVEEISKDVDTRVGSAAGLIESSLFVDGQKAGLSDGQIMELANIFGWDIDFALEIRAGDQFRVLFEEQYLDGEKLRNGPILAAEFTNRGTTYRAVRYEDANGEVGYFDADGQSKRRAFIRTPIKFARVSSGFNPKRWHPILKKWRSHKGVDYAAPTGTPVKATGDGRIVFRGNKNGYGKTVIIEHASKYTTLYAHLSGYSKRAATGKRVKQGQVIGYVGKTGLASGPHLHYEFRVQGQHRDPLRVKLPKSLGLPQGELASFQKTTAPLLAQLEAIPTETLVASAGSSPNNP